MARLRPDFRLQLRPIEFGGDMGTRAITAVISEILTAKTNALLGQGAKAVATVGCNHKLAVRQTGNLLP